MMFFTIKPGIIKPIDHVQTISHIFRLYPADRHLYVHYQNNENLSIKKSNLGFIL